MPKRLMSLRGILEKEAPRPQSREDLLENHTFWLFAFVLFTVVFVGSAILAVYPQEKITGQLITPELAQQISISDGTLYQNTVLTQNGIELLNSSQGVATLREIVRDSQVNLSSLEWSDMKKPDSLLYFSFDKPNPKFTRDSVHGGARIFESEDYIDTQQRFNLTDFSIETWVKTKEHSHQAIVSTFSISNQSDPASYNPSYILMILDTGQASFLVADNATRNYVESTTNITDNNWHQIIAVRDTAQKKIALYIDGRLEKIADDPTLKAVSPQAELWIGNQKNRTGRNYKGLLDETLLYNRTITQREAEDSYTKFSWRTYAQLRTAENWTGAYAIPHLRNSKDQLALLTFDKLDAFWQTNAKESKKPSSVQGRFGSSVKFQNDQALVYPSAFLNTSQGTIDLWIKLENKELSQDSVMAVFDLSSSLNHSILLYIAKEQDLNFYFSIDAGGVETEIKQNISDWRVGEWHYIAASWVLNNSESKRELRLAVDDLMQSTQNETAVKMSSSGDYFSIGNDYATRQNPLLGEIDDMQILNIFKTDNYKEKGYTNPSYENLTGMQTNKFQLRFIMVRDGNSTPAITSAGIAYEGALSPLYYTQRINVSVPVQPPQIINPAYDSLIASENVILNWTKVENASAYNVYIRDRNNSFVRCLDCGNNCEGDRYFVCVLNYKNTTMDVPLAEGHFYTAWVESVSLSGETNSSRYTAFTAVKKQPIKLITPPIPVTVKTITPTPVKTISPQEIEEEPVIEKPAPIKKQAPSAPVTTVRKGVSAGLIIIIIFTLAILSAVAYYTMKYFRQDKGEAGEEFMPEKFSHEIKPLEEITPAESGIKLKPIQQKIPAELRNYIKTFLDRGFTKERIKKTLLEVGWDEELIDEGFKEQSS